MSSPGSELAAAREVAQLAAEGLSILVAEQFAAAVLPRLRAGIAFLDPPYELAAEYETALAALDQSETPLVILQHSSRFTPPESSGRLQRYRVLKQGDNSLSFYRRISTNNIQHVNTENTNTERTPTASQ